MSQGKTCTRCYVVSDLKTIIAEYEYFLKQMSHPLKYPISAHARGFNHGRVQMVENLLGDLKALIPFITKDD